MSGYETELSTGQYFVTDRPDQWLDRDLSQFETVMCDERGKVRFRNAFEGWDMIYNNWLTVRHIDHRRIWVIDELIRLKLVPKNQRRYSRYSVKKSKFVKLFSVIFG